MKKILFSFCFLFAGCGNSENMQSVIIDKIYVPDRIATGVGLSSSGKMVVTTTGEAAKHIVVFKEREEVVELDIDKDIFYKLNKGDTIFYTKTWYSRVIYKINK